MSMFLWDATILSMSCSAWGDVTTMFHMLHIIPCQVSFRAFSAHAPMNSAYVFVRSNKGIPTSNI